MEHTKTESPNRRTTIVIERVNDRERPLQSNQDQLDAAKMSKARNNANQKQTTSL